ncbi:hypothetical protein KM043_003517 [Ampulex compressa]|nr:hypothetical protein KM043_003517 [Ampulex compressa]
MLLPLLIAVMLMTVNVPAKSLGSAIDESINKIDHGTMRERKNAVEESNEGEERISALTTKEQMRIITEEVETTTVKNESAGVKVGPFSWFLAPLSQKFQFVPQSFFQDRIQQLKATLNNLGLANQQNATAKQLGNIGGLLHLVGPNDSGFYTNRLEPAGLLGGNGWLANKGGILGGPGAFLSTGSLLTDYPTPYRKK